MIAMGIENYTNLQFQNNQINTTNEMPTISDDLALNDELSSIEFYLKICEKLLKIYPIMLLTIGTCGNLISFFVLMYGSRKKSTTFSYLSCLALIDLAVIATFCLNFISLYNFNKDLQDNLIFCKFYAFLIYYLPQYSAWTLSIVSVDRMLALLQVNITHRYSTATTPIQSPKLARNGTFIQQAAKTIKNKTENRCSCCCCFLAYFYKKPMISKSKSISTSTVQQSIHQQQQRATPSITTTTETKKPFCLVKCFNTMISSYNFRISEKYRAFVIVSVIGILLFLLNSHFLFIYSNAHNNTESILTNMTVASRNSNTIELLFKRQKISESSVMILLNGVNVIKCSLEHNHKYKNLYGIWVHIDSIINVYLPFTVMIVSSFMIIMCVLKSMKAAGNYRYHKIARNISLMLVSLNFMFILLTAPIVIQLAIDASSSANAANITLPTEYYNWHSPYSDHPFISLSSNFHFKNQTEKNLFDRESNRQIKIIAKRRLIKLICIIIMNSNHACNIMVYCLIGREFRRHFVCAIRRFIYGDSKYKQYYVHNNQQQQHQQQLRQSIKARKLEENDYILSTSSTRRPSKNFRSSERRRGQKDDDEDSQQKIQQQKQLRQKARKKYKQIYRIPFKSTPNNVQ